MIEFWVPTCSWVAGMSLIFWEARLEFMRCEMSRPAVATGQPPVSSALVVLVMAAQPHVRFVAALGGAVQPLVHAPEAVQSARIGGVGVVDFFLARNSDERVSRIPGIRPRRSFVPGRTQIAFLPMSQQ